MNVIKGMKVLVTGSTGFIGANIVKKLIGVDAQVHILTRKTSNKWRIKDFLKDVNEYCVDLSDYDELEKVILNVKPEIIIHTAIYGGYPFQKDVQKIIESNFIGTVNLINACKKTDFKLFINTGSSSEYGIKSRSMTEDDLLEPIDDYGVSKAAATLYCQAIAMREKKSIVTLRLFSPYGYYEEPTRLIPSVVVSCLRGKNPTVLSPDSVRDFIFIEDVIDAYMKVIETSNIGGEIFNIGSGRQHSVGNVVDAIIKLTGNKVKPELGKSLKRPNEPDVWQADISKAKNILKWEPKHDLEWGLAKTVKWFKENETNY